MLSHLNNWMLKFRGQRLPDFGKSVNRQFDRLVGIPHERGVNGHLGVVRSVNGKRTNLRRSRRCARTCATCRITPRLRLLSTSDPSLSGKQADRGSLSICRPEPELQERPASRRPAVVAMVRGG